MAVNGNPKQLSRHNILSLCSGLAVSGTCCDRQRQAGANGNCTTTEHLCVAAVSAHHIASSHFTHLVESVELNRAGNPVGGNSQWRVPRAARPSRRVTSQHLKSQHGSSYHLKFLLAARVELCGPSRKRLQAGQNCRQRSGSACSALQQDVLAQTLEQTCARSDIGSLLLLVDASSSTRVQTCAGECCGTYGHERAALSYALHVASSGTTGQKAQDMHVSVS